MTNSKRHEVYMTGHKVQIYLGGLEHDQRDKLNSQKLFNFF